MGKHVGRWDVYGGSHADEMAGERASKLMGGKCQVRRASDGRISGEWVGYTDDKYITKE